LWLSRYSQEQPSENILGAFWGWTTKDSISFYTAMLFVVTAILAGVSFVQIRFLIRADKTARISANAAKESADVARASSEAAIAFERPYVRISEIKASIRGDGINIVFQNTGILREPSAICVIENYGKTPAFVEKTQAQLMFSADDPQMTLERGKPIPIVTLKTGQSYRFEVPLGEVISQQRAEAIQSGEQHFWLHFNFVYRDVLGKTHQTPDKWKYSFPLDSFSGGTSYKNAT
jgi:hypothetical protein